MQFVWWLTGVCFVIALSRFVILVFKRLMSKENMDDLIDKANNGLHSAANKAVDSIEQHIDKRREKKKERERPIVEIH